MHIINHKYIFLTLSGILVLGAAVSLATLGLKQGIDFVGGSLWQISSAGSKATSEQIIIDQLELFLKKDLKLADFSINEDSVNNTFIIRFKETTEADHQNYLKLLKDKFPSVEELSFESIGASIGHELRRKALWSFLLVLSGISLYVAFAFRKVSRPVSSWKYGIITLLTLFHDALIPAGLMAFLGWWQGTDIGVNFIVAILVVMGFSVHDTIVVFDRIRENLKTYSTNNFNFGDLVNKSIMQTLARSINTSLTLVLVLLAIYFLGASSLYYFTLVILLGTVVGTYSSIFVASPLLVLWQKRS